MRREGCGDDDSVAEDDGVAKEEDGVVAEVEEDEVRVARKVKRARSRTTLRGSVRRECPGRCARREEGEEGSQSHHAAGESGVPRASCASRGR